MSTLQTKNREIDGIEFAVTMLPAMRGLKLQARAARLIAPALSKASDWEQAVGAAFAALGDDDVEQLARELLYNATAREPGAREPLPLFGPAGCFDRVLAGRYATFYKLLAFAAEVNFEDFFVALKKAFADVDFKATLVGKVAGKPAPSPSPTTSSPTTSRGD